MRLAKFSGVAVTSNPISLVFLRDGNTILSRYITNCGQAPTARESCSANYAPSALLVGSATRAASGQGSNSRELLDESS